MEREGFLGNFLNKSVFCRCCMFTVYLLTFWDSEISRFFYLLFTPFLFRFKFIRDFLKKKKSNLTLLFNLSLNFFFFFFFISPDFLFHFVFFN